MAPGRNAATCRGRERIPDLSLGKRRWRLRRRRRRRRQRREVEELKRVHRTHSVIGGTHLRRKAADVVDESLKHRLAVAAEVVQDVDQVVQLREQGLALRPRSGKVCFKVKQVPLELQYFVVKLSGERRRTVTRAGPNKRSRTAFSSS